MDVRDMVLHYKVHYFYRVEFEIKSELSDGIGRLLKGKCALGQFL
jgi:hypothetical protein